MSELRGGSFWRRVRGIPSWAPVAAASLAVALPGLWPGYTLVWREDAARFSEPLRHLVVDALRGGRLPLWNPYEGLGKPLFAEGVHAVLHPVSILCALVFPGLGEDGLIAAWLLAASLGAWVLARQLGASPAGSALAGFAYGLSGFVVGTIGIPTYLGGAASLPWALAGAVYAGKSSAKQGMAVLAIGVCCLAFSGDFQALAVALPLAVLLPYAVGGWRGAARGLGGSLSGLLTAAPQLWPTWIHIDRTFRSIGFEDRIRREWALAPLRLFELIAPHVFEATVRTSQQDPVFRAFGTPTGLFSVPFAPSVFIGAPVLLLAILGLKKSRATALLAIAAGLSLWIALGWAAGAEPLLHHLPVWRDFRYSEKMVGPFTLFVAALAGVGVDSLACGMPRWLSRVGPALLGATALAALGLFAAQSGLVQARLGVGMAYCAISLAVCWLAVRWRPGSGEGVPARLAAVVLVQCAGAVPFALNVNRAADLLDTRPPVLAADGPVRLETPLENAEASEGSDFTARTLRMCSELGCPATNVRAGIDNVDMVSSTYPFRHRFMWADLGADRWRGFRRFAATHLLLPARESVPPALSSALEGAEDLGVTGDVRVFRLPHRPWAFFAEQATAVPDRARTLPETVQRLTRGDPDVVIQGPSPAQLSTGRVLTWRRRLEDLEIEADAPAEALLVVNDAYWPGWEASVDGKDAPIWPADFLVRAVPFPAGRHTLRMWYRPPEIRTGEVAGMVGLVGILALGFVERRRWSARNAPRA